MTKHKRKIMPNYSDYGLFVSIISLIFFIYATYYQMIELSWGFTFILFFGVYIISIFYKMKPNSKI